MATKKTHRIRISSRRNRYQQNWLSYGQPYLLGDWHYNLYRVAIVLCIQRFSAGGAAGQIPPFPFRRRLLFFFFSSSSCNTCSIQLWMWCPAHCHWETAGAASPRSGFLINILSPLSFAYSCVSSFPVYLLIGLHHQEPTSLSTCRHSSTSE